MVINMDSCTKEIGPRGEIVLPKKMRDELHLKPKTKVEIVNTGKSITLIPKNKLSEFAGYFGKKGVKHMEEIEEVVQELLAGM
mgnify:CR=1 FL=1